MSVLAKSLDKLLFSLWHCVPSYQAIRDLPACNTDASSTPQMEKGNYSIKITEESC